MDGDTLLNRFERCEITLEEWTHRMHLRVACEYLARHPFGEALDQMRVGIQRHNAAHGIESGPDRGYHETVTCAWMHLLHALRTADGADDDAEAFLSTHEELMDKRILLRFYTRDRIMSEEARVGFVEPDVAPF